MSISRRSLLQTAPLATQLARPSVAPPAGSPMQAPGRVFRGLALREIAFPLGGSGNLRTSAAPGKTTAGPRPGRSSPPRPE